MTHQQISSDEVARILKRYGVCGEPEALQIAYRKKVGQRLIASLRDPYGRREVFSTGSTYVLVDCCNDRDALEHIHKKLDRTWKRLIRHRARLITPAGAAAVFAVPEEAQMKLSEMLTAIRESGAEGRNMRPCASSKHPKSAWRFSSLLLITICKSVTGSCPKEQSAGNSPLKLVPQMNSREHCRRLYKTVAPYLDPGGFVLYETAAKLTRFNIGTSFRKIIWQNSRKWTVTGCCDT